MTPRATMPAVGPVADGGLRCVWSHDGGCDALVPSRVVLGAWREEMSSAHRSDGFFYFSWRGGEWLGYGMPDGSVRGVYCAAHRAERAGHLGINRAIPALALVASD